MYHRIVKRIPDIVLKCSRNYYSPESLRLSIAYAERKRSLMSLKNVAINSGNSSTCASSQPSYLLQVLGVDDHIAHISIRFPIEHSVQEMGTTLLGWRKTVSITFEKLNYYGSGLEIVFI